MILVLFYILDNNNNPDANTIEWSTSIIMHNINLGE